MRRKREKGREGGRAPGGVYRTGGDVVCVCVCVWYSLFNRGAREGTKGGRFCWSLFVDVAQRRRGRLGGGNVFPCSVPRGHAIHGALREEKRGPSGKTALNPPGGGVVGSPLSCGQHKTTSRTPPGITCFRLAQPRDCLWCLQVVSSCDTHRNKQMRWWGIRSNIYAALDEVRNAYPLQTTTLPRQTPVFR